MERAKVHARQELEKLNQKPNEPCRCGSGKKFKKCCRAAVDPSKLDPNAMVVVGQVFNTDGSCRSDMIMVRVTCTQELVAMPHSMLCRDPKHAQGVQKAKQQSASGASKPTKGGAAAAALRGRAAAG